MIRKQCLLCNKLFAEDKTLCEACQSPLSAVMVDSLVGSELKGKYVIESELGRGGMGTVYGAIQRGLDRKVAIKMLLQDVRHDEVAEKRFEGEARALSALSHPNIVRIFDFDVSEFGLPFIAMEFVEGRPLSQDIARNGRLEVSAALKIFSQICDALEHAHRRQIVHRDLKPSNIMLVEAEDGSDRAVVLDFGIAKIFTHAGMLSNRLTKPGEVFGSPLYMSPEQCMGQSLDQRSDIYSLGCLMFEAISGHAPFVGQNFLDTVFLHVNNEIPELPAVSSNSRVQEALGEVISRMMAKKSTDRYESMLEIRRTLLEINATVETEERGQADDSLEITQPRSRFEPDYEEPNVADWRRLAEKGDAAAQFDLGFSYRYGEGIKKDYNLALYWLLKSANQDYAEAQYSVAIMYSHGIGMDVDYETAFEWWLKASNQGHPYSQYELGCCFRNGEGVEKDLDKAFYWFKKGAENGHVASQDSIGQCYQWGDGVEIDYHEAMRWYERGADQGYEWSMLHIGELYEGGKGVEQDYATARSWYQTAADKGLNVALHKLSLHYRDGLGVEKDPDQFLRLVTASAESGYCFAQLDLADYLEKTATSLSKYQEALRWYELAAEDELPEAQQKYFQLKKLIRQRFGQ